MTIRSLFLAGAVVAVSACGQSTTPTSPTISQVQPARPSSPNSSSVVIALTGAAANAGESFSPDSVSISPGGQVTFTNNDAVAHVVTADDGSWSSGSIDSEATSNVTFPNAGTFRYHDAAHPEVGGTIVVQ